MRATVAVLVVCSACTMRGSGKSATPDFKRYTAEVPLRVDAGSSDVVSASITEVSTVLGLQHCFLNLWWRGGGDAKVRVADPPSSSMELTIEKIDDASTASASHKSQNNLGSHACRRPIVVVVRSGEIQLAR